MPLYDYQCKECGKSWEVEQKISEEPIKECPYCGKKRVKRLIGKTAFQLMGGGWSGEGYSS